MPAIVHLAERTQTAQIARADGSSGLQLDCPHVRSPFDDQVDLRAVLGAVGGDADVDVGGGSTRRDLEEDELLEERPV